MELISSSNEDDVLEDEDSVEERVQVIDNDSNASSEAKNRQSRSGSSEDDGDEF